MGHCPTCTCAPSITDRRAALSTLARGAVAAAGGSVTVREVARSLGGGREPLPAEVELVRRCLEHEVRAGRLRRAGVDGRVGGTPAVLYALA
jgi:hypothetical protein